MRNCRNCNKECLSFYCCKECKWEIKRKTTWVITKCQTCGKDIECRISRIKKFCSIKCASVNKDVCKKRVESIKNTCLEKYGVDHIMKTEYGKNQLKKSMMERYGVDSFSKTDEFKEKFNKDLADKKRLLMEDARKYM